MKYITVKELKELLENFDESCVVFLTLRDELGYVYEPLTDLEVGYYATDDGSEALILS